SGPSFVTRMLVLPSGQVLLTNGSNRLAVYTPVGSPATAWKPTISSVVDNGDGTFTLTGTQLNGLSEGAGYGDDAEMSSNYPLIRLVDANGHVAYARTFNWSSTGVATGSTLESVQFTLPAGFDESGATLTVVANGIASDPTTFALSVTKTTPANGDFVTGVAPTDFVVHPSQASAPTPVQASALTVNGIAADSMPFTDATTLTFHYNTSPVTTPGQQQMAIAAGAILAAKDESPIQAFNATFRYAPVHIAVVSTNPPNGGILTLPFTNEFVVHFNTPYDPASISTSNLQLSTGAVTGVALIDSTTVGYRLNLPIQEGTLTVNMAAGSVTDPFGNPMLPFQGSYLLHFGTVPFPTPLKPVQPLGSLI